MRVRQILYVLLGLWSIPASHLWATTCLRLTGIVEDQVTQQPLAARLFVKTPDGRTALGNSQASTGRFIIEVPCTASVLRIECPGYRPQQLLLTNAMSAADTAVVTLIIPLFAVDPLDIDKPYLQTEQTHYEQTAPAGINRWQHQDEFVVADALSGRALLARVCFFFTKGNRKTCLDTGADGRARMSFPEKDIVAIEITAPTYQSYQGNLIIDTPNATLTRHSIKLTRELTILALRLDTPGNCTLRPVDSRPPTQLRSVPGFRPGVMSGPASPGPYTLLIYNTDHTIREQRTISLKPGLNSLYIRTTGSLVQAPVNSPMLDSLPVLYFDQGSYLLRQETKTILLRTATYLKEHPGLRVQIAGHADPEGDPRLNYSLSENRVKVVSSFLSLQGVAANQIESVSHGSRFPVAPSDTETNKIRNRRVHLRFLQ